MKLLAISVLPLLLSGLVQADAVTTYEHDVRPILERHCVDCHSGWFPDAGLDLSEREDILAGGRSGPLVVAGKPDKGWLMHSITRAEGRQQMPPSDAPPLSEQEKAVLVRWIEQGLK
jgi:uncharacterized membrane protein